MKIFTAITIFIVLLHTVLPSDYWGMLHVYFYSTGQEVYWLMFIGVKALVAGYSVGHISVHLWMRLNEEG